MSSDGWRLNPDAEERTVHRWLEREHDPFVRLAVLRWLQVLAADPLKRGVQERPGVFSALVPDTDVVVVWTLDVDAREIVLALIGDV